MEDYVSYNKEMQEVTITYGALEEQVGLWLVDIINNKLIWRFTSDKPRGVTFQEQITLT